MNPLELFEVIREKGMTAAQAAFMESGKPWPADDPGMVEFIQTMIGIGIAVASEHYAQHPAHLSLAGQPICAVCREPIQSLQVGADPARDPAETTVITVAWPCSHIQPEMP